MHLSEPLPPRVRTGGPCTGGVCIRTSMLPNRGARVRIRQDTVYPGTAYRATTQCCVPNLLRRVPGYADPKHACIMRFLVQYVNFYIQTPFLILFSFRIRGGDSCHRSFCSPTGDPIPLFAKASAHLRFVFRAPFFFFFSFFFFHSFAAHWWAVSAIFF